MTESTAVRHTVAAGRAVHIGPPVVKACERAGWVTVACRYGHVHNILPAARWEARRVTELVCSRRILRLDAPSQSG